MSQAIWFTILSDRYRLLYSFWPLPHLDEDSTGALMAALMCSGSSSQTATISARSEGNSEVLVCICCWLAGVNSDSSDSQVLVVSGVDLLRLWFCRPEVFTLILRAMLTTGPVLPASATIRRAKVRARHVRLVFDWSTPDLITSYSSFINLFSTATYKRPVRTGGSRVRWFKSSSPDSSFVSRRTAYPSAVLRPAFCRQGRLTASRLRRSLPLAHASLMRLVLAERTPWLRALSVPAARSRGRVRRAW